MRKVVVLLTPVLLSACGGYQPVNYSGPAVAPNAMQCATEELQEMGYSLMSPAPGQSTVTGIQINSQPWYKRVLGFQSTSDQITVTATGNQLQVTAISSDPTDASEGGRSLAGDGATEDAARDARQIIGECTGGA